MKVFLETDRLLLRQFTEDDADHLLTLDSDPEVMRYSRPLCIKRGSSGKCASERYGFVIFKMAKGPRTRLAILGQDGQTRQ